MAELVIKLVNGELAGKSVQSLTKDVKAAELAFKKAEAGTQEWVDTHAKLEGAKKLQGDLKKQIDSTSAASNTLKQQFMGVLSNIPGFSQLTSALGAMRGGVGGLTSGFGLLKGAIAATGIGLLVLAVAALVGWFTKTETGANMISGAFKGIGAVVDTLMGKLWNIGATLKEFLANPIQFFKNLGKDIAGAAKEGYNLVQTFDKIEDKQRNLAVKSKEQDILVDQLLLQAKNAGKTYSEKIALLNQADKITRDSYQEQLALSKEYVDAVNEEIASQMKQQGMSEMNDDQAEKRKDAMLAYLDLKGQEIQTEEKIANRREQIVGKQTKAIEKSVDEKKKTNDQEIVETQNHADDELKILQEIEDQKKVVREKAYSDAQAENNLQLSTDLNVLNENLLQRQITEEQYAAMAAAATTQHEEAKLAIIRNAFGETSAEYQAEYAKYLDIQKAAASASVQVTKKQTDDQKAALIGSLQVFGNVYGVLADMQQQGTEQWKAFATAQAIISTIQGGINAYTSTVAIPYVGPVLAPIAAAAALAAGYASVKKIQGQKVTPPVKSFGKGGIPAGVLNGPSHAQGGIPLFAEGNEIILTKGVFQNRGLRAAASALNVAGGGRSFAAGGPTNPFDQSRGQINRGSSASPGKDPFAAIDELNNNFKVFADSMDKRFDRIKVINNLQDTRNGLSVINRIINEANV